MLCEANHPMTGERDLAKLLQNAKPELHQDDYVFCTLPGANYGEYASLKPIGSFQEKEGLTLILMKCQADTMELNYQGVFRCITLQVYSSLEAVGLTSAVASRLAENGISANVLAAFYHDHVFVPEDRAEQAMALLGSL